MLQILLETGRWTDRQTDRQTERQHLWMGGLQDWSVSTSPSTFPLSLWTLDLRLWDLDLGLGLGLGNLPATQVIKDNHTLLGDHTPEARNITLHCIQLGKVFVFLARQYSPGRQNDWWSGLFLEIYQLWTGVWCQSILIKFSDKSGSIPSFIFLSTQNSPTLTDNKKLNYRPPF